MGVQDLLDPLVLLVLPDHLEQRDRRVQLVALEQLGQLELQVVLEQLVCLDLRVPLVLLVYQATQDSLGKMDQQD